MQTISVSVGKQKSPDQHLGFCILPPDAAHVITSGLFVMHICHIPKVIRKRDEIKEMSCELQAEYALLRLI